MSNTILLAIALMVLTISCICMNYRIERLEKNQNFLVDFVNKLQKEILKKNDSRDSNEITKSE